MRKILPEVVGDREHPVVGRFIVREFADSVEALYVSGNAPGETERLNVWMAEAGLGRVDAPKLPGWSAYSSEAPTPPTPEENRARAARRARQSVRWKCRAIAADRLLTLTHRENITDKAASRRVLSKFLAMCRKEWGRAWRFVCVPERQQRGAWHWHLALPGFWNVHKLRAFWWRAHGERVAMSEGGRPVLLDASETPGNVDICLARKQQKRRGVWHADNLAGYLAKYIGKAFDDSEGAAYACSRGIEWTVRPFFVRGWNFDDIVRQLFTVVDQLGGVRPYWWTAPDRKIVWATARIDAAPELLPPAGS